MKKIRKKSAVFLGLCMVDSARKTYVKRPIAIYYIYICMYICICICVCICVDIYIYMIVKKSHPLFQRLKHLRMNHSLVGNENQIFGSYNRGWLISMRDGIYDENPDDGSFHGFHCGIRPPTWQNLSVWLTLLEL